MAGRDREDVKRLDSYRDVAALCKARVSKVRELGRRGFVTALFLYPSVQSRKNWEQKYSLDK